MSLIYNATFDSQTRVLSLLDKAGNVISSCEVPSKELVDDITKPLTFKATQDGSTVKLGSDGLPSGSFQTSRDGGNTWVDYTMYTAITLNTGDEVSFRAKANRTSAQSVTKYFYFMMEGKIEAWHNVMSLYRTNDFATYESVMVYSFYGLFNGCTSLTKAPVLPATTLADSCYSTMFRGCQSLTKAPELPATTLAKDCYRYMFSGCTSLVNAPVLPATTLANGCYASMFSECTSLAEAPELPATTLAKYCYWYMFSECTSLTKAPVLPATTLADSCYGGMFSGCSSLNEVHCHMPPSYSASDISSTYANNWLTNVSPTGTFYTNADANWASGASGIPEGWTRVPAVDDPNKPLMLRAIEDNSSVTLTKIGTVSNTYQTSTNGTDWTNYTLGTKISLNNGESVYFRRRNNVMNQSEKNYVQFVMEGKIEAWHNAYSMIKSSFTNTGNSVGMFGMCRLFEDCKSLTKAPLLVNTVLEEHSYFAMFSGCTSLTKAPALPATTLRYNCYTHMFDNCTSLILAPELPATTLAEDCYNCMFLGCTSLTKAPSLPATTLVKRCYEFMFYNCTSLTQAPELPATALINYCYTHMFDGCTSLTKAPVLPATSLADYCYYGMFVGCSSLKEVRIYATNWATGALDEWLSGVSATGDFYCDPNATIFSTGASGIPANWTRHALADYPVTP